MGLKQEALNNANKACDIFQKEINKYKIDNIVNTDFAAALVAQGNALAASKKYDDALLSYNQAESIYFKRYGDNYNKMDDINYLLSQGAKVSCTSKNPFWKKHFYDQLVNNFDLILANRRRHKKHRRVLLLIFVQRQLPGQSSFLLPIRWVIQTRFRN